MTTLLFAIGAIANADFLWAAAFHSGGVGACSGCHIIHGPQVGGLTQALLRASDPSSICLNCHAGSGGPNSPSIFSPNGSALTPGGDFYWLTRTYSWVGGQSPGYGHGHNIVARDFNLVQDPVLLQAPGGTYPSDRLGCTSCHDPHGRVSGGPTVSDSGSYGASPLPGTSCGNYRLLGDSSYNGGGSAMGYSFVNNAPIARQSSVNKYGESDASHVAYGSGMSEWCVNCHTSFGGGMGGPGGTHHKAGNNIRLQPQMISNYDAYVRTGDMSGIAATAYLQFVSFERGVTDPSLLDPAGAKGPDSSSNVMCLTCHRAHASAFDNSGRWDFRASLLSQSHPASGDTGAAANDVYYSYYGRDIASEFGSGQGAFCEKCHGAGMP